MMTPEQEVLARSALIRTQLTEDEKTTQSHMLRLRSEEKQIQVSIKEQQANCTHPLSTRQASNGSNTGNYDRDSDSYWTAHFCDICGLRWTTSQRWQHVGTKLGLPSDMEAKE